MQIQDKEKECQMFIKHPSQGRIGQASRSHCSQGQNQKADWIMFVKLSHYHETIIAGTLTEKMVMVRGSREHRSQSDR